MTTMLRRISCSFFTLFTVIGLLCTIPEAKAQDVSGSINGAVRDPSGAVVAGATVTIYNVDRGFVAREVKASDIGTYTATSLPPGAYSITAQASGFQKTKIDRIVLHVSESLTVNVPLKVGGEAESVEVQADAVSINLEDATSSGLINGTQMRELVLNNRNYEQLLALQPGVAYGGTTDQLYIGGSLPSGTTATVSFSVNGGRNSSINWTIDGADNVDRGSNQTLLAYPSVDAITEFTLLRGTYSAAFGRSASGQVNLLTKSGTNQLHGTAYEFVRNDQFNANSYFNNLSKVSRSQLRYNDFGFTVGGPVWIPKVYNGHSKTFFFYSNEFRRVITYAPTTTYAPTADERNGIFTIPVCGSINASTGACNSSTGVTTISTIDPTAQAYIKDIYSKVPTPNASSSQDKHTLTYNQRSVYDDSQTIVRVDHSFNQKLSAYYRYIHDTLPTFEPGGLFTGGGFPGVQASQTHSPGTQQLGHVTLLLSPSTILDLGYAYSSGAIKSTPVGLVAKGNSPDINPTLPYASSLGTIPNLSFTALTGISSAGTYNDYNRNHNPYATLTRTMGHHTVIAGVTYDHYQKTENATTSNSGTFSFSATTDNVSTTSGYTYQQAWANFLQGVATGGYSQASFAVTPNIQTNQFEAFAQDNWKILPTLSVNLGVRYSYFGQPVDKNNMFTNFDPSTWVAANAPTIDTAGYICTSARTSCSGGVTANSTYDSLNGMILGAKNSYGHTAPWAPHVGVADKGNFAPRVGFALDVFGNGKTALRGGYGIAYDATLFGIYEYNVFYNQPYVSTPNYTVAQLSNPASGQIAVSYTPPVVYWQQSHFHTPYTEQFSLDVQQMVTPTLMLDVGYFGDLGKHLLGVLDMNELQPGVAAAAGLQPSGNGWTSSAKELPLNQLRPYKGYNAMNAYKTIFGSNYNSLQVQMQKRFHGKSLVDVNYTWSRSLTDNQTDRSTAPQNTYNIAGEYGRSQLDRHHILSADYVWELPWFKEQKGLVGRILGGWENSGILAMNSGLPFTVTMSGGGTLPDGSVANDAAGLGILGSSPAGLRPNMTSNPNQGTGLKTRTKWFNTAAFTAPTAASGKVGNEHRGVVNGPGFVRVDMGLFRNFKVKGDTSFQLRAEAFNLFNHTNWATVATTATTTTTFGTITAARDPRIMQFAGKFTF